jgi:hypothetical protein
MQQTSTQKTENETTEVTTEKFIGMIKAAETHLTDVKVIAKKLKRGNTVYSLDDTNTGTSYDWESNGIYKVMYNMFNNEVKATVIAELESLKSQGLVEEIIETDAEIIGLTMIYMRMSRDSKGAFYPPPSVSGLSSGLTRRTDLEAAKAFVALFNTAVRLQSLPFYTEGEKPEAIDGKVNRGHAGVGLLNILADINGPASKLSTGISPGYILTGRAYRSNNEGDQFVATAFTDAGIGTTDTPAVTPPAASHFNSWRRLLDCNEAIRGYYIDLGIWEDGLPALQVVVTDGKKAAAIKPPESRKK